MQFCVQNITTVRYLLDLYERTQCHHPQKAVTATLLDVNVYRSVVVLYERVL